ncbi:MAG TPA: PAS domain-containing protein [Bryobacteraceae bacterium]|nr:PAS domain-containing protein [Bryobacteraceae bacterium]
MASALSAIEYQALVEQAPIMIWRANTTSECDYFNDRWLLFRGRPMEQETGNQWAEGVHAEDFDQCLKTYLESFARREVFEMHYRLKRADGEYRWIFDRGVPFYADDGTFQGYIGSCIDVTERILAQRALQEAQERELAKLRGLLRICSACKKIHDPAGEWEPVETYIANHTQADFTHGLCPECTTAQLAMEVAG